MERVRIETKLSAEDLTKCAAPISKAFAHMQKKLGYSKHEALNALGYFYGALMRQAGADLALDKSLKEELPGFVNGYLSQAKGMAERSRKRAH